MSELYFLSLTLQIFSKSFTVKKIFVTWCHNLSTEKWSQMIIWRAKLKISYFLEIKTASSSLALDKVFGPGENYLPKKKQTLLLLCVCVYVDQLWGKQHSLTVAGHESACLKYLSQEKYHKLNRTISHKTSATIWPWP